MGTQVNICWIMSNKAALKLQGKQYNTEKKQAPAPAFVVRSVLELLVLLLLTPEENELYIHT